MLKQLKNVVSNNTQTGKSQKTKQKKEWWTIAVDYSSVVSPRKQAA